MCLCEESEFHGCIGSHGPGDVGLSELYGQECPQNVSYNIAFRDDNMLLGGGG